MLPPGLAGRQQDFASARPSHGSLASIHGSRIGTSAGTRPCSCCGPQSSRITCEHPGTVPASANGRGYAFSRLAAPSTAEQAPLSKPVTRANPATQSWQDRSSSPTDARSLKRWIRLARVPAIRRRSAASPRVRGWLGRRSPGRRRPRSGCPQASLAWGRNRRAFLSARHVRGLLGSSLRRLLLPAVGGGEFESLDVIPFDEQARAQFGAAGIVLAAAWCDRGAVLAKGNGP